MVANKNNTWSRYPEQMFKSGADYTIGKFTFGTLLKVTYAFNKNGDIALTVKDLIMSNFNQYYNYWQGQYVMMGLRAQDPRIYLSLGYKF